MLAGAASLAFAQDIKIAHVYGKTGALEAYAKQTQAGLMLGLEYATNGTMTVNGPSTTPKPPDPRWVLRDGRRM